MGEAVAVVSAAVAGAAGAVSLAAYRHAGRLPRHDHPLVEHVHSIPDPVHNFYDLMGDLWDNPADKPAFAPPTAWINTPTSATEWAEHLTGCHVYGHAYPNPGGDPEWAARSLMNRHDAEHSLDLPDHHHYQQGDTPSA